MPAAGKARQPGLKRNNWCSGGWGQQEVVWEKSS